MCKTIEERALFKRTLSHCVKVIGGLGLGMLVAILLVSWRLSSGPVSLGFLTPYLETALGDAHQGNFDITVEDTILTWAGWERTLDIRVVNVQSKLSSGDVLATIPEVSVSLSVEALLKGVVAPRSIEFFSPRFSVQRDTNGRFSVGFDGPDTGSSQNSNDFVGALLSVMLEDPDPSRPMSYLTNISVVGADLTYQDMGLDTTWHAPSADATFLRIPDGLKAELDLDLKVGSKVSTVSVSGTYLASSKRVDLGVSFEDILPAEFAGLTQDFKVLSALDLPLSGTIALSLEANGHMESVSFDVTGRKGHLALPVAMAAQLGILPWAQRIAVTDLSLNGRYDGVGDVWDISALNISTEPGEVFYLPAPLDHPVPLNTLKARLNYLGATGQLDIVELSMDLGDAFGGLTAGLSGTVVKDPSGALTIDFKGLAKNVRYDDLPTLWPKKIGVDVRTWVMESLSKGVADQARIDVSLDVSPDTGVSLKSMSGDISSHGLNVNYISTMPRVKNAKGTATFNEKRFDINIESGTSNGGLEIKSGTVALVDLQKDLQWAEIKLNVHGPVPSALKLIDAEPLRFASSLGLKPNTAKGTVSSNVSLRIPLKNDLTTTEVEILVTASLKDAGLQGVVFDKDVSSGDLNLTVDNLGLSVQGKAELGQIPVELKWNHDFRTNALFTDRYEVSGYIENVLNLGSLGIQVPDILSRYMRGGAEININHTRLNNGQQSMSARIDLAKIDLSVQELGWQKPVGVPGTAALEMRIQNGILSEIPAFSVEAPEMNISGAVSFLKDGTLERVSLDTMRSSLTDISGSITPLGQKEWEVVLRGESLDARELWDELRGNDKTKTVEDTTAPTPNKDALTIHAAVDIRSILLSKGHVIHDLIGSVYRDQGVWRKLDVSGVVGDNGNVELMLDTAADGLRYLSITSNDAGATLKTLGLHDNILGGKLDLKAAYTTPGKFTPLEGVLKVQDYAMLNAPTFAKLIGVMSLTGILDALQGEGLNFDILDVPFKLEDGVLDLSHARASGPTIGVSATGTIDMGNKALDLHGTVVPAYAINALLGKIPLIGPLFSGGEEGGGLFAATYTMKGEHENVNVTVNPLSVLAPGVLRNIFMEPAKGKDAPKNKPKAPK